MYIPRVSSAILATWVSVVDARSRRWCCVVFIYFDFNRSDVTQDQMFIYLWVVLQGEKGGASGHKRSSLAGAAGPGHEPEPANIPGPGCRRDPGETCWVRHNCTYFT